MNTHQPVLAPQFSAEFIAQMRLAARNPSPPPNEILRREREPPQITQLLPCKRKRADM